MSLLTLALMNEKKRNEVLGGKLKALREQRGLTQGGLGAMIGRTQVRIHKWEDGEGHPDGAAFLALSEALQVPLRFLLDDGMTDPDQAIGSEPVYSPTERRILELVKLLGPDRAMARLMALPEGTDLPRMAQATLPLDQPEVRAGAAALPAPPAKTLSSTEIARKPPQATAKKGAPKRSRKKGEDGRAKKA